MNAKQTKRNRELRKREKERSEQFVEFWSIWKNHEESGDWLACHLGRLMFRIEQLEKQVNRLQKQKV